MTDRRAHDSKKPGVERSGTPGYRSIKNDEPAKAGTAVTFANASLRSAAARSAGLGHFFVLGSRGSRPGLYADVRSAHLVLLVDGTTVET
jgi:hypothetical protein